MGDIADMVLDGTLCQECGEYVGDDIGYPRSCAGCSGDNNFITSKQEAKERKKERLEEFPKRFNSKQWKEWKQLSPYHFRQIIHGKNLDYWPTTTRTQYDGKTQFLNSMYLKQFIKQLKQGN